MVILKIAHGGHPGNQAVPIILVGPVRFFSNNQASLEAGPVLMDGRRDPFMF